ncbi:MAG TPA: FecR family protein [Chitinophaga sp.]
MDTKDLARLSGKYLDGTASAEEQARLLQWYNAYNEEELTAHLPAEPGDSEALLELRLRARIQAPPPLRVVKSNRTIYWAAAASAVVLLAAGGYFYQLRSRGHRPAFPATAHTEIRAGTNKATLTLADGSVVALDSLHNGQQLLQGHTRLAQATNGKIVYAQDAAGHTSTVEYNTLKTPRGGQYNVVLSDGTAVWLNAASSITYPATFSNKAREVRITGEAYFEVAADAHRPFTVKAGNTAVMVLGTRFNINAYTDEHTINTTLAQGAVLVQTATAMRLLSPGQQSRVVPGSDSIEWVQHADLGSTLAWKNGYFSFEDANIPAVMRQLSRWYNIDVTYQGKVPEGTFTGEIGRSLTQEQLLYVLTKAGIHFKMEEGQRLVISQ